MFIVELVVDFPHPLLNILSIIENLFQRPSLPFLFGDPSSYLYNIFSSIASEGRGDGEHGTVEVRPSALSISSHSIVSTCFRLVPHSRLCCLFLFLNQLSPGGCLSRLHPAPRPIVFSVLLTKEGKLFRWGVEDGDIYPFPTAVCTQIPLPCVEVCCGRKHTMALMKGGVHFRLGSGSPWCCITIFMYFHIQGVLRY